MASALADETYRANRDASLDDPNAALDRRVELYNRRPQPWLGGLAAEAELLHHAPRRGSSCRP